jgi:hypothetical protein
MAEYSEEVAHNKILIYANEEFVIDLSMCLLTYLLHGAESFLRS